MIRRYTVYGNPIAHSMSPQIHALFAEQTHRQIEYTRSLATEANFADEVRTFVQSGAHGFNITAPFKQLVLPLCEQLSPAATRANAVNTVKVNADQTLSGHNTDGSGLVTDIVDNNAVTIKNKSILIAGAGGATRGILLPLLEQLPSQVVIANRTLSKAEQLTQDFADCGPITSCDYNSLPHTEFDLVINATSSSLSNELPPLPSSCIASHTTAYDLSYGKETPFMLWAKSAGAEKILDGFGMLLEQAADAFFIWEEIRPKTRLIAPKLSSESR